MLENWRYNRARTAALPHAELNLISTYLEQEYRTQLALQHLGVAKKTKPGEIRTVGKQFLRPDLLENLRIPYAVEVLGMPRAGKTTLINRYLQDSIIEGKRHRISLIPEGAGKIKEQYSELRKSNPFLFSILASGSTLMNYLESLPDMKKGMYVMLADRGLIDRRVFRRALFSLGQVLPNLMMNEDSFISGAEGTPVQMGGVIMLMTKPEVTMERSGQVGPIANTDFIPALYEQYWRLHWEMLQGEIPYRLYTCIDAEQHQDAVYEQFKYAMDSMLQFHEMLITALRNVFPEIAEQIEAETNDGLVQHPLEEYYSNKLGRRVTIIGGDEMEDTGEFGSGGIPDILY